LIRVLAAHPAHQKADLALGELASLVEKQQVARLAHCPLLVTNEVRSAEVDDAVLGEPQARRRRGVKAIAAAVDLESVLDQRAEIGVLPPHDEAAFVARKR